MAFKITLPSTANTRDIRVAVRQECVLYNVPFEDIRLDKLDIYKARLSPSESNALLQEIKNGRRIANSEWKTSLLGDLGLLSHYFTKQPDKTAIHLIVDCTAAVKQRDKEAPRWSIDEVPRDTVIQEVDTFLLSKLKEFQRFDSRKF
ncbi:hypothetical protein BZG36_05727, partial [Bifiguratus adelaidae]